MRGGGDGRRRGPVGVGEAAGRHDGEVRDGGEDDGAVGRRDHHRGRRRLPVRRRRGRVEGVAFCILQDVQAGEGRRRARTVKIWELKIREVKLGELFYNLMVN